MKKKFASMIFYFYVCYPISDEKNFPPVLLHPISIKRLTVIRISTTDRIIT
jgi:hypothetical protein